MDIAKLITEIEVLDVFFLFLVTWVGGLAWLLGRMK